LGDIEGIDAAGEGGETTGDITGAGADIENDGRGDGK